MTNEQLRQLRNELAQERRARQRAEARLVDCQRQLADLCRERDWDSGLTWPADDGPDLDDDAQIRAAQIEDRNDLCGWFNMIWYGWTDWRGEPFDGPATWRQIPDFVAAGLTRDDLQEALSIAMHSQATDKWSYFCGVCWRMIREAQDVARQIIESEARE